MTTSQLIDVFEWGTDMGKFEASKRYLHVEAAASALSVRTEDPEATNALCSALCYISAFTVNPMEGVDAEDESRLQAIIAGKFLTKHKCLKSTVALIHAATSGSTEDIRYQATKTLTHRPVAVVTEALQHFMSQVGDDLMGIVKKELLARFGKPEK